jgi:putative proteasome-type protease
MTYCVALALDQGIVMLSDTRTNAGPDNIASFSKLSLVEKQGDRVIALMASGNLACTQAIVARLTEGLGFNAGDREPMTLWNVATMYDAACLVGEAVRQAFLRDGEALLAQNYQFDVNFLLAGEIAGSGMHLFMVYSAGNFIEATQDTPFLQIGETKYGKPIIDRVIRADSSLATTAKCLLISMDSTIRSNLSVGMPLDLAVLRRGEQRVTMHQSIGAEDAYFRSIREGWGEALRNAFHALPELAVPGPQDQSPR